MISNAVWGWWIQVNQQLDMFELVDDMYAEDRLFAEDRLSTAVVAAPSIWKILVIDDEPDIHQLTRMVLRGLRFDGLGI
ncbi:MAG: hypothetical protein HQL83_11345, partial [Magnetococcales bacterium]|nr:hypothetical protein [Magnetococcales bacterium]